MRPAGRSLPTPSLEELINTSCHCEEEHTLNFFWNSLQKRANFEDHTVGHQAAAAGRQRRCNILCRFPE